MWYNIRKACRVRRAERTRNYGLKKNLPVTVLHLLCMAAALALDLWAVFQKGIGFLAVFSMVLLMAALAFGVLYTLYGYKKQAAPYYQLFMALYAFINLLNIVALAVGEASQPFPLLLRVDILMLTVILASAKDFGKARSYLVTGLLLLCALVLTAYSFVTGSASVWAQALGEMMLAATSLLMVLGKYADKDARGTI